MSHLRSGEKNRTMVMRSAQRKRSTKWGWWYLWKEMPQFCTPVLVKQTCHVRCSLHHETSRLCRYFSPLCAMISWLVKLRLSVLVVSEVVLKNASRFHSHSASTIKIWSVFSPRSFSVKSLFWTGFVSINSDDSVGAWWFAAWCDPLQLQDILFCLSEKL